MLVGLLTAPSHGRMAWVSWPGWLITFRNGRPSQHQAGLTQRNLADRHQRATATPNRRRYNIPRVALITVFRTLLYTVIILTNNTSDLLPGASNTPSRTQPDLLSAQNVRDRPVAYEGTVTAVMFTTSAIVTASMFIWNCTRDGKRGSIKWSYDREYRIKLYEKILLWQVQHSGCISWATSSRL